MKVVFILGSGHCGATLLDLMLDSHSRMFGVGEMHAAGARRTQTCSCKKPGSECPVWLRALGPLPWRIQSIFKYKRDFFLNRGLYRLASGTPLPVDEQEWTRFVVSAYRSLLEQSGKNIIVDSSKQPERAELLARSPEIEPIFIHLVRDGRGSTWTYINKYKELFPFFYMWATANLKVEVLRRRLGGISRGRAKFAYLRFADLIGDPEGALRRLCALIGVEFEPGMLRWDEREHHEIEGNRTRFVPGHVIYPDEWRKTMPTPLRVCWTLCFGWLNAYYTRIKKSFGA